MGIKNSLKEFLESSSRPILYKSEIKDMSQNATTGKAFEIESNSIDYVDASQRNGNVKDLFTLWFCTNRRKDTICISSGKCQRRTGGRI